MADCGETVNRAFEKLGEMLDKPPGALMHQAMTNTGVVVDCPLCAANSGTYDSNYVCCQVRFILGLGDRKYRIGWLEKWRSEDSGMADRVESEVRERWGKRARLVNPH